MSHVPREQGFYFRQIALILYHNRDMVEIYSGKFSFDFSVLIRLLSLPGVLVSIIMNDITANYSNPTTQFWKNESHVNRIKSLQQYK